MPNQLNYWWVTRPKRKLNSIPEVLAAFSNVALTVQWSGRRDIHILFEDELERTGLKRVGQRRDHSGSGGRTYQAWLSSLGLIFIQNDTGVPYLTLAGEAIMHGQNPVTVLKEQVLKYQFPSPFGIKTHVAERFRIRPFLFLLRLLMDNRIENLSEEEIGKIVITNADRETDQCYEMVVNKLFAFRESGDASLPPDFLETHKSSRGSVNPEHPYLHLTDTANTMVNWLEYTQLIYRENGRIRISPDKREEVTNILNQNRPFLQRPEDHEFFQRKYGLDPGHVRDNRNLLNTQTVTTRAIEMQRIRQYFIALSMHRPIARIDQNLIAEIADGTGTTDSLIENVLYREYPHGAVGGFLVGYYEMAFQGRDEATDFEIATTNIFQDIFNFNATHLGQTGRISAPDVMLVSDSEGYQAIIDNKAYREYSVSGDHHNRMVHNYLENIGNYSTSNLPIGFFTYISGGFGANINQQIQSIAEESNIPGSGITVGNMIKLIEKHQENPYTHAEIRRLFGLNRQIQISDL